VREVVELLPAAAAAVLGRVRLTLGLGLSHEVEGLGICRLVGWYALTAPARAWSLNEPGSSDAKTTSAFALELEPELASAVWSLWYRCGSACRITGPESAEKSRESMCSCACADFMRPKRALAVEGGAHSMAYTATLLRVGGALGKYLLGNTCPAAPDTSQEASAAPFLGLFVSWRCGQGAKDSTLLVLDAPSCRKSSKVSVRVHLQYKAIIETTFQNVHTGAVTGRSRGIAPSLGNRTSSLACNLLSLPRPPPTPSPPSLTTGVGLSVPS
jgi:hypothetical protein